MPQAAGISLSTLKVPDSIFRGLFDSNPSIKATSTCWPFSKGNGCAYVYDWTPNQPSSVSKDISYSSNWESSLPVSPTKLKISFPFNNKVNSPPV